MKKVFQVLALTVAVTAASVAAAFSSGGDTVISLSYLSGTYMTQLTATVQSALVDLDAVYRDAITRLEDKTGQGEIDPSWTTTAAFQTLYPRAGETVTLGAGAGLMWYSGSGAASTTLVDVTDGTELAAGSPLTAGHRYLAEGETLITASASASCAAEGLWKTTATGTAPVQSPFRDVTTSAWYFDAVMYVVEHDLFTGTGNGNFAPEDTMNRAMLVTVLYRLAGEPATTGSNPFTDVADTWYTAAVIWAAETGVVTGTSPTTFAPNAAVTREQIALMLHRYCSYYGYDSSGRASLAAFGDQNSVSGYALEGVSWAVSAGLLQGANGNLLPTSSASRSQVATLIQRYCLWIAN